jgi:hypothetical protein
MPIIPGGTFVLPTANNLMVRDFYKEGQTSSDALQRLQEPILNMYTDLYNAFAPAELMGPAGTGYAATAADRLQTDLAALRAAEQGQLSAEDVRAAQQAAREAYAARGQAFAPGAVGAEILGRDTLRRQREQEARNVYQQSMQNVANAVQLKTGNLFQPIASLISGTFNPYSSYGNAVYDYNVNAYNEYQAAKENLAAYKEAAANGREAQFLQTFAGFLTKNGIQSTTQGLKDIFSLLGGGP